MSPIRSCLASALAALLFATAAVQAQQPGVLDTAATLRDHSLAGSEAYALVSSLTTEVGARLAGSPANARAEDWAEREFKRLGYDRVWRVPVTIPLWQRRHERARVLGDHEQSLLITALGHSISSGGPLRGEVVELADIDALRAIGDDRLRGKIVFINKRMERHRNGAGYSAVVDARTDGPAEAARRGAAALLIRSIGTDSHRFPHTGNIRRTTEVHAIPAAALSAPDADQLQRLLAMGGPLQVEIDIDVGFAGETTVHHVIGEITGREQPERAVVLGAHLDSWDLGTGAVDDGAGIGITMAAGAAIAKLPQRPRRSVQVIAFAAEEVSLLGAKSFAAGLPDRGEYIVAGIESDFGAGRIYALQAGVAASAQPLIRQLVDVLQPLGIEFDPAQDGPGPDIGPLWQLGVPWISLKQDGQDYFDLHHTADDTLDKIEPAALDQQVAAYAATAWTLADSDIELRPAPAKPE